MADVINLNRYRKAKQRAEKARLAEEQRARHGRSKTERTAARREQERQAGELDGKRLGPPEDPEDGAP
jgi:hypothetical protein